MILRLCSTFAILSLMLFAQSGRQRYASLGNFRLDNGQIIQNLRLGYRTLGHLNRARSNAILMPTWFSGVSKQLLGDAGPQPGKLIDTRRWYAVLVDSIGDGVSSSPSNSRLQPRMDFPRFSLLDMVHAEHRLLTHVLHLRHVQAVIGISMGGFQTFQWAVTYPNFMTAAIPIVGSPRPTAYGMLLMHTSLEVIRSSRTWRHGQYLGRPQVPALLDLWTLHLTSPRHIATTVERRKFKQFLRISEHNQPYFDLNNWIRQGEAVLRFDITRPYGGRLAAAAARVKAKMLIVPSQHDHMVVPDPAERFARLVHARIFLLTSDCGHMATACQRRQLAHVVRRFLAHPARPGSVHVSGYSGGSAAARAQLRRLIARYAESIDQASAALAARVWWDSSQVSFINPVGWEHGFAQIKKVVYENLMGRNFARRKLTVHGVAIHVHGDSAWAEFDWDFHAVLRRTGLAVTTHGRETQIYWKIHGDWRLVHVHYSSLPVSSKTLGISAP